MVRKNSRSLIKKIRLAHASKNSRSLSLALASALRSKMHEMKIVNENEKDAKELEKMNRKRKLIAKTKINVAYKRRMAPHPV